MPKFLIQTAASFRIDEIYHYTLKQWGATKAESYITGLFTAFEKIDTHDIFSRPIPAELGIQGFFFRYERHFVYWKFINDETVGIVTILHERMHQIKQFKHDEDELL